jgi:hypothetical protein
MQRAVACGVVTMPGTLFIRPGRERSISSSNLKLIEVKPDGLLDLVDEILCFTWLAIVNQSQSIKSSNLTVGHTVLDISAAIFN